MDYRWLLDDTSSSVASNMCCDVDVSGGGNFNRFLWVRLTTLSFHHLRPSWRLPSICGWLLSFFHDPCFDVFLRQGFHSCNKKPKCCSNSVGICSQGRLALWPGDLWHVLLMIMVGIGLECVGFYYVFLFNMLFLIDLVWLGHICSRWCIYV